MAINSIIYLDSNVYAYAASRSGDRHQRRLTAEAQSVMMFVQMGMLRLVHSGLVDDEVDQCLSEATRKRIRRAMPQPRHYFRSVTDIRDLEMPALALAERIGIDDPDAAHALIAARAGAEFLVSAESGNFVAKLRNYQHKNPKEYESELGGLTAVDLINWHAEVIERG